MRLRNDPNEPALLPGEARTVRLVTIALVTVLLTQRLGVMVLGLPLSIAPLVIGIVLLCLFAANALRFDPTAGALYLLLFTTCAVSTMASGDAKATSLAILLPFYFVFTLHVPLSPQADRILKRRIGFTIAAFSVVGIVQFGLQFIVHSATLFSWKGVVPSNILIEYNTINRLSYGSSIIKANGFFLLEPAQFGQLAARGFAFAISAGNPIWVAASCLLALLFSYSGTGFIVLGVFLIAYLVMPKETRSSRNSVVILGCLLFAGLLAYLLAEKLELDSYAGRVGELGVRNASGYQRFITPLEAIFRNGATSRDLLLGHGAGSAAAGMSFQGLLVLPSTWSKILYEYGFSGLTAYTVLVTRAAIRSNRWSALTLAILVQFFILDSAAATPQLFLLNYILSGMAGPAKAQSAQPRSRFFFQRRGTLSPVDKPLTPRGRQKEMAR